MTTTSKGVGLAQNQQLRQRQNKANLTGKSPTEPLNIRSESDDESDESPGEADPLCFYFDSREGPDSTDSDDGATKKTNLQKSRNSKNQAQIPGDIASSICVKSTRRCSVSDLTTVASTTAIFVLSAILILGVIPSPSESLTEDGVGLGDFFNDTTGELSSSISRFGRDLIADHAARWALLVVLLLLVPCTHYVVGYRRHGGSWEFFQPFRGGNLFVAVQAFAWTFYGIAVAGCLAVLLYGVTWFTSKVFAYLGLAGFVSQCLVLISMHYFSNKQVRQSLTVSSGDDGKTKTTSPRPTISSTLVGDVSVSSEPGSDSEEGMESIAIERHQPLLGWRGVSVIACVLTLVSLIVAMLLDYRSLYRLTFSIINSSDEVLLDDIDVGGGVHKFEDIGLFWSLLGSVGMSSILIAVPLTHTLAGARLHNHNKRAKAKKRLSILRFFSRRSTNTTPTSLTPTQSELPISDSESSTTSTTTPISNGSLSRTHSSVKNCKVECIETDVEEESEGSDYRFFQPFQGGLRFVILQCIGWTLWAFALLAAILTTYSKYVSVTNAGKGSETKLDILISTVDHSETRFGTLVSWLLSQFSSAALLSALSQVVVLISLQYFDAQAGYVLGRKSRKALVDTAISKTSAISSIIQGQSQSQKKDGQEVVKTEIESSTVYTYAPRFYQAISTPFTFRFWQAASDLFFVSLFFHTPIVAGVFISMPLTMAYFFGFSSWICRLVTALQLVYYVKTLFDLRKNMLKRDFGKTFMSQPNLLWDGCARYFNARFIFSAPSLNEFTEAEQASMKSHLAKLTQSQAVLHGISSPKEVLGKSDVGSDKNDTVESKSESQDNGESNSMETTTTTDSDGSDLSTRLSKDGVVYPGFIDSSRPHMFCFHPHGIYPATCYWATRCTAFFKKYAGLTVNVLGASVLTIVPVIREVFLWSGGKDVSKKSILNCFSKGRSVILVPGGQREMQYIEKPPMRPEMGDVTLYARHYGFIRLAMQNNIPLVPVISFGENLVIRTLSAPKLQMFLYKTMNVFFPLFPHGRFFTQTPSKVDLSIIYGEPIILPSLENPTQDELKKFHRIYYDMVAELFEEHKEAAGFPDAKLEILF